MSTSTAPPPRVQPRSRVAVMVTVALLGVAALAALTLGGGALYGDAKKDDAGFLAGSYHRFATDRSAIATENLDVDADVDVFAGTDDYGKVRVQVEPNAGEPVFVGIARSRDVDAYLAGTDHTRLTDVGYAPFETHYEDHPAARRPSAPAEQRFWATSTQGTGRQTLTWDARHGAWSVVVMNADGSPRVDTDVRVGAQVPILDDIGWTGLGLGLVFALTAGGLVVVHARSGRRLS